MEPTIRRDIKAKLKIKSSKLKIEMQKLAAEMRK
jgi:hypothetical protein